MNLQNILNDCIHLNNCEKLVLEYWDMMCSVIRKALRIRNARFNEHDVEDLRNEVFIQLFGNERKKLRQFDESYGLSLKGWIILIANQTVGMYLRKKDRSGYLGKGGLTSMEDLQEELGIADDSKRYEARDLIIRIEKAMMQLPHSERLLMQLLFEDGLNLQDAAKVMNRTPNNIFQIRHRAVKRLKEIIEKI